MIPLYSLWTPSHAPLKDRFFLPSVPKEFDLRLHFFDNPGAGFIHDQSFCRAIVRKVEVILQAIEENWGGIFVWSDVDTQFFRSIGDTAQSFAGDFDIVFQIDAPGPVICDGFFVCRAHEHARWLWQKTLEFVRTSESRGDDQLRVRQLLEAPAPMRVGFLPPTFMGGGTLTGSLWVPGQDLPVVEGIVAHHANFTCGVPDKIAQCELVQRKVAAGDLMLFQEACARTGAPWLFAKS